jgi:hypothetical protein
MESGRSLSSLESRTLLAWSDGVYKPVASYIYWHEHYPVREVWRPTPTVWWKPWTWFGGQISYETGWEHPRRVERVQSVKWTWEKVGNHGQ